MNKSEKTGYHPCPFCGSEDVALKAERGIYRMRCCDCCVLGPIGGSRTAAIYAWNNRSDKAEIYRALLEAMEFEELDKIQDVELARKIGGLAAYRMKQIVKHRGPFIGKRSLMKFAQAMTGESPLKNVPETQPDSDQK